jgi:hypothetical protein
MFSDEGERRHPVEVSYYELLEELEGDWPICTSLSFERGGPIGGPLGQPITARFIRSVNIGALIEEAIVWLALSAKQLAHSYRMIAGEPYTVDEHGRFSFWTSDDAEKGRSDALIRHRRRVIDDAHLRYVAQIYKNAPKAPTEAVAEQLHTAKRNATRWVAMARERGFIPPYHPADRTEL